MQDDKDDLWRTRQPQQGISSPDQAATESEVGIREAVIKAIQSVEREWHIAIPEGYCTLYEHMALATATTALMYAKAKLPSICQRNVDALIAELKDSGAIMRSPTGGKERG